MPGGPMHFCSGGFPQTHLCQPIGNRQARSELMEYSVEINVSSLKESMMSDVDWDLSNCASIDPGRLHSSCRSLQLSDCSSLSWFGNGRLPGPHSRANDLPEINPLSHRPGRIEVLEQVLEVSQSTPAVRFDRTQRHLQPPGNFLMTQVLKVRQAGTRCWPVDTLRPSRMAIGFRRGNSARSSTRFRVQFVALRGHAGRRCPDTPCFPWPGRTSRRGSKSRLILRDTSLNPGNELPRAGYKFSDRQPDPIGTALRPLLRIISVLHDFNGQRKHRICHPVKPT